MPKLTNRVSFSNPFKQQQFQEVYGFDLFYQLTYMSAVAAAGISRSRIFQMGAELPRIPAAYFERVHLLAQKMGYDYARACTMVGLGVKSEAMVSLLLRLATALTSGQPERDFLEEETLIQGKAYEKEYEKDLASLTKWTDAYAAVTISATLMIIINMTSSLIYPLGNGIFIGLVATAALTSGATAWILSRAAPKEVIDLFSPDGPWTQRVALQISIVTFAALFIVAAPLLFFRVQFGVVILVAGLMSLPLGIFSILAGRQIDKKDREFGPFLRSLGGMAVSTGTTISEALSRIDLSSFPSLESDLERLQGRLRAAIDPEICWRKFAAETGSKLIAETVTIFQDAVRLGGDPDVVALHAADFSARTIMLRAQRKVTAGTFTWLTVVMHGAVSTLMVLIFEIVRNFVTMLNASVATLDTESMSQFTSALPSFSEPQIEFFRWMTICMIVLLSIINAYAISATDGGHKLKIAFYLSLMFLMAGGGVLAGPLAVEGLF